MCVLFSSVTHSCQTLCNPMDCSMPGFPVHHQLPELTQIHVHWVGDAIQLFHPLSSPSPPAFCLSQSMVFSVPMYRCEKWRIKEAEHWKIDAFEVWCWIRLLRVPWTSRRSNQSILKEISPEYSLEGLILKWELQYFGLLMGNNWLTGKDPDAGKDWRQEKMGTTKDEMVGWHHWPDGHEFVQTLGDSKGRRNLVCCSPWGCKSWTWLSD